MLSRKNTSTLVLLAVSVIASTSASEIVRPTTLELRAFNRFGDECVVVRIKKVEPWNDIGIVSTIEVKNTCPNDKLVDIYISTDSIRTQQQWDYSTPSRLLWPEERPYPKEVRFVPMWQLQSGFVIRHGESATTQLPQFLERLHSVDYDIGSCDWNKHGKMRVDFHDASLRTAFACATLEDKPEVEQISLKSKSGMLEDTFPIPPLAGPEVPPDGLPPSKLPRHASTEFDAMISDEVSGSDAEALPRDAAEARVREEKDAERRALDLRTAAAAEKQRIADEQRLAQEAADHGVMQSGKVGEVFALGDRLESEHNTEGARSAYRALLRRFPDHPLASSAASRLAAAFPHSKDAATAGRIPDPKRGGVATGISSAAGNGLALSGDCENQYAALNKEFSRPGYSPQSDTIAMLRIIMFMSSESLRLGSTVCKGNRHESELTQGMQAAYDGAMQNCIAISAAESDCKPRRPN